MDDLPNDQNPAAVPSPQPRSILLCISATTMDPTPFAVDNSTEHTSQNSPIGGAELSAFLAALSISERTGAEVALLSIGGRATLATLSELLVRGATTATLVHCDPPPSLAQVVALICHFTTNGGFDAIFLGEHGSGEGSGVVPIRVATELREWAVFFGVTTTVVEANTIDLRARTGRHALATGALKRQSVVSFSSGDHELPASDLSRRIALSRGEEIPSVIELDDLLSGGALRSLQTHVPSGDSTIVSNVPLSPTLEGVPAGSTLERLASILGIGENEPHTRTSATDAPSVVAQEIIQLLREWGVL